MDRTRFRTSIQRPAVVGAACGLTLIGVADTAQAQPTLRVLSEIAIHDGTSFDPQSESFSMDLPFSGGAGLSRELSTPGPGGGLIAASTFFSIDAIRVGEGSGPVLYEIDISGRLSRTVPLSLAGEPDVSAGSDLTFELLLGDDINAAGGGFPLAVFGSASYESNQTGLPSSFPERVVGIDWLPSSGGEIELFELATDGLTGSETETSPIPALESGSDLRLNATSDLSSILITRAGTSEVEFQFTLFVVGTIPSPASAVPMLVAAGALLRRRR